LALNLALKPSQILEVLRDSEIRGEKKENANRAMFVSPMGLSMLDAVILERNFHRLFLEAYLICVEERDNSFGNMLKLGIEQRRQLIPLTVIFNEL
jgi:hypothetical protein